MRLGRSSTISNILVAIGITLIVNFSYLLLLIVNTSDGVTRRPRISRQFVPKESNIYTGKISISKDGYGYIVDSNDDSVYVNRALVNWMEIHNGDSLEVEAYRTRPEINPEIHKVLKINGEKFDYGALYNSPARIAEMTFQIVFYFAVSFMLLLVMGTTNRRKTIIGKEWIRMLVSLLIVTTCYFIAPVMARGTNKTIMLYQCTNLLDFIVMLKCSFMFIVVLLYSKIYGLVYEQQQVVLENEQLKNENLTTKYNMLVNQINPHFLFNSLSSLSMLVREGNATKAIKYIEQLSYTFRYITQKGTLNSMVTLEEEMEFANAYCYLFKIRYDDKLDFNIRIDDKYRSSLLPALSIQPLIGNAVKHNAISSKKPLVIDIFTEDGYLIVHNRKSPMLENQEGTGTGLRNLDTRYRLISGSGIERIETDSDFTIKLKLENGND